MYSQPRTLFRTVGHMVEIVECCSKQKHGKKRLDVEIERIMVGLKHHLDEFRLYPVNTE